MKQILLALSTLAALSAMSIAAANAQSNRTNPARHLYDYQAPSGNDYYDSGCHTVITHSMGRSGVAVTSVHRVCS